jgi:tRNA 2-thiouridine synthesizing protein E
MNTQDTTARLEAKIDALLAHVERLEKRQRAFDELMELAMPMAKVGLDGLAERFGELERAGWFAIGKELFNVADRVVRSYSADDVRRLGDQVVGILDTVRNVTQPDVLGLVNDVAGAVHGADEQDPKGMWGLMRAGKDPDVRKGFGVMVGILKQVGRAADRIGQMGAEPPPVRLAAYQAKDGKGPAAWVKHLAPRRRVQEVAAAPVSTAPVVAPASPLPPGAACSTVAPKKPAFAGNAALPAGYGLDGFITDPALWTRESAIQLAELMSLPLGDAHWHIITWARDEYAAAQASPNIRRISQGAGVPIRDLYALFPGKPGVLVAMLAGIPKPGGCL